MSLQRTMKRSKLRGLVYSAKDNHKYNRRRFRAAWRKIQVNKFGGLFKYILMRVTKMPIGKRGLSNMVDQVETESY